MAAQLSAREVTRKTRRFDKKFKKYRQLLGERHGQEFAKQISECTRHEYQAVLRDSPKFAGRLNLSTGLLAKAPSSSPFIDR